MRRRRESHRARGADPVRRRRVRGSKAAAASGPHRRDRDARRLPRAERPDRDAHHVHDVAAGRPRPLTRRGTGDVRRRVVARRAAMQPQRRIARARNTN